VPGQKEEKKRKGEKKERKKEKKGKEKPEQKGGERQTGRERAPQLIPRKDSSASSGSQGEVADGGREGGRIESDES